MEELLKVSGADFERKDKLLRKWQDAIENLNIDLD